MNKNLINCNDKIVIGLSGGPDSVCLAYQLNQLKDELHLELILAHVNYKLRGRESDGDEEFCRKFADTLSLPIHVLVSDLSGLKSSPGNIQSTAREIRLKFYEQVAVQYDCHKIALAHTANDNIETVFGNIIRGCGLAGLAGIAEKSGNIIRPLLHVTKADILEFLNENRVEYRIDSSNMKNDYTRNKIRNELIPHIKQAYNPRIEDAITRLSQISTEVNDYLQVMTDSFIKSHVSYSNLGSSVIPLEAMKNLEPILIRTVLKSLMEKITGHQRGVAAFDRIDSALKLIAAETGTKSDLGDKVICERGWDALIIYRERQYIAEYNVQIPGKTDLPGFNIMLHSLIERKTADIAVTGNNRMVSLDYDKLTPGFSVRQVKSGDRFRPLGMAGSKKVGDFFTDRGVPGALRPEIPLFISGGRIAWIMGQEISELFKVDKSTATILKLWVENFV